MTLKEICDMSLQLINQFSIVGKEISDTYNGQADYLRRIPSLVNDCLVYLYTNAVPQVARYVFTKEKGNVTDGVFDEYELPMNFCRPYGSSVPMLGGKVLPVMKYRWMAGRRLAISPEIEGEICVEYYRYPILFSTDFVGSTQEKEWNYKDGSVECDAPLEAQYAIPYYVAAHLIQQDYLSESYIFMNEFELKMSRLHVVPVLEVAPCEDVYGFGGVSE